MTIVLIGILISILIGFIIIAVRERVLNKSYDKKEMSAYLLDMANYVATKELRDDFDKDYTAWQRKVEWFKNYLLSQP